MDGTSSTQILFLTEMEQLWPGNNNQAHGVEVPFTLFFKEVKLL